MALPHGKHTGASKQSLPGRDRANTFLPPNQAAFPSQRLLGLSQRQTHIQAHSKVGFGNTQCQRPIGGVWGAVSNKGHVGQQRVSFCHIMHCKKPWFLQRLVHLRFLIDEYLTPTVLQAYADSVNEKRNHPRAPIELKVEYKKMNTFFADYTKNISKGGTFIKTDKPLPIGTEFLFKLTLPNRADPFELHGTVVWINRPAEIQNPEVDEMGMGIRFIFDEPNERDAFESEVEVMMVDSLGPDLYEKLIHKKARYRPS